MYCVVLRQSVYKGEQILLAKYGPLIGGPNMSWGSIFCNKISPGGPHFAKKRTGGSYLKGSKFVMTAPLKGMVHIKQHRKSLQLKNHYKAAAVVYSRIKNKPSEDCMK